MWGSGITQNVGTQKIQGEGLVFADETSMRAVRGEKHGDGTGLDELMSMDSRVPG